MENNEANIWVKFCGKKIATEKLNIEGFNKPIPFDIYDGYAVCNDFEGHRYDMTYPQMAAIKESEELANAIIDYIKSPKVTNIDEISVIDILITFNTLYQDGIEIKAE